MIRFALLIIIVFPALAFASEGGGKEHSSTNMLIFTIVNFVIFAGLLFWLLKKPLREFIANRAEELEQTMADAAKAKEEAEARLKEVNEKLEALSTETGRLKSEMDKEASRERERLMAMAEASVKRIKEEVKIAADQELLKAKTAIRQEAVFLAVELAEKLIKDDITDDDRKRLVNEYLKEIEQV